MYGFDDQYDDIGNNTTLIDQNGTEQNLLPYFLVFLFVMGVFFVMKPKVCPGSSEKAVLIDRESIIPIASAEIMDEFPCDVESQLTLGEENKVDETDVIIAVNHNISVSD